MASSMFSGIRIEFAKGVILLSNVERRLIGQRCSVCRIQQVFHFLCGVGQRIDYASGKSVASPGPSLGGLG